ncbi:MULTISPECIES: YbaB/EbfC family nucleoid-associated protein [Anaerotruncus]|jgi:DNA-binding YbaB/EbfC family protein|uniref:YbaB/EbfC family nucleoid-associated protein n=1 Tax=Anaerotruncus TaxID=244127 RepID=UPI00082C6E4B|nr:MULTISPECIES: YbaB/EbfC family nucleoid-associated protein [Anaerotruncus]RGX52903.1 YbaB/EbfC family nucleoid-associated protein [Anaerotruncus sp. AF02-27]
MKARLPKGMGGGAPNNMNAMIRQAQKIQEDMRKKQEELAEMDFKTTAGGGMVEVTISGKKELKELILKPEVVNPDDIEMLQDLIMAAVNEAIRTVEDTTNAEMDKIAGGLNVPGVV